MSPKSTEEIKAIVERSLGGGGRRRNGGDLQRWLPALLGGLGLLGGGTFGGVQLVSAGEAERQAQAAGVSIQSYVETMESMSRTIASQAERIDGLVAALWQCRAEGP